MTRSFRSITPAHSDLPRRARGRTRRRRLFVGCLLSGLVTLTVLIGGTLAFNVVKVRQDLERGIDLVAILKSDLEAGDSEAAELTFQTLAETVESAHSSSSGLLWKAAEYIPIVGPNFRAVSEVAVSARDVTTLAVGPLLSTYESLDWAALSPTDGRVDVSRLRAVAPKVTSASNAVNLSHDRLAAIDPQELIPSVAGPFDTFSLQLKQIKGALNSAAQAANLLPVMLGSDEARTYLVLVQNNAEVRATGGIPGALVLLHADDGYIQLGEQSSAGALGTFRPPVDVDSSQTSIFTARIGTQMQNVNLTPDFPTAARAAKDMWERRHAMSPIDGVLAIDPIVLSLLLGATGSVDLTDPDTLALVANTDLPVELSQGNVVETLLSQVYMEIEDPELQDAYFAAVASRIFNSFMDGHGDTRHILGALADSTTERRLLLWSSHANEQNIIASTPLAGSVAGTASGGASFGVYFNDGTGAKMDYYAERSVQLTKKCVVHGYRSYTAKVAVKNNAPLDAASSLPAYVTGGGAFSVEPGSIQTNYVFYGPAQSVVEGATVDGRPVPFGSGLHGQRPVGTVTLRLAPGASSVVEVSFSKVVQTSAERVEVTPAVADVRNTILPMQTESCQ